MVSRAVCEPLLLVPIGAIDHFSREPWDESLAIV